MQKVTVTLDTMMSPNFSIAFEKLQKLSTLKGHDAFKVKKLSKLFKEEIKEYSETRADILKSLAKKDEKGEPIIKKDEASGIDVYDLDDEGKAELTKKVGELLTAEVEVPYLIKFEDLPSNHGITANDLEVLEFIVE